MPLGPGKYDELATLAREAAGAEGVILIVINGSQGGGFSCQAPLHIQLALPKILRAVADDIEGVLEGSPTQ